MAGDKGPMVRTGASKRKAAETVEELDDFEWVGKPLSQAEVRRLYPLRQLGKLDDPPPPAYNNEQLKPPMCNDVWIAARHFTKVKMPMCDEHQPGLVFGVGDTVAILGEEEVGADNGKGKKAGGTTRKTTKFLINITEMFEDIQGTKVLGGRYWYQLRETQLANPAALGGSSSMPLVDVDQDLKRVWLATECDNAGYVTIHQLDTIDRVVRVVIVAPEQRPPAECDYWCDQAHTRDHYTFRNLLPQDLPPALAAAQAIVHTKEQRPPASVVAPSGAAASELEDMETDDTSDGGAEASGSHDSDNEEMEDGDGNDDMDDDDDNDDDGGAPGPAATQVAKATYMQRRNSADAAGNIASPRARAGAAAAGGGTPGRQRGGRAATLRKVGDSLHIEQRGALVKDWPSSPVEAAKAWGNMLRVTSCTPEARAHMEDVQKKLDEANKRATSGCQTGASLPPRKLKVLELCCGAGGLSFLAQEGTVGGREVSIEAAWACDIDENACNAYRLNHGRTSVHNIGIIELLWLMKKWKPYVDKYGSRQYDEAKCKFLSIQEVRLRHTVATVKKGQGKDQLDGEIEEENSWLEFCVLKSNKTMTWIKADKLGAQHEHDLIRFVEYYHHRHHMIPVPGDVQVISGGPPCQEVSGLNRHAPLQDVLKSKRNSLVKAYFDIVAFLKPDFILLEQVMNILSKEQGRYARFVASSLARIRYQCRVGYIPAGHHGCAQGRLRCLVWGAAPHEVLPSFPEPSHNCPKLGSEPTLGKTCAVGFLGSTEEEVQARKEAAWRMSLQGDIIADLPPCHNYSFRDEVPYAGPARYPFARYLRRAPPGGQLTRGERVERARAMMETQARVYHQRALRLGLANQSALGYAFMNQKKSGSGKDRNWFSKFLMLQAVDPLKPYRETLETLKSVRSMDAAKGKVNGGPVPRIQLAPNKITQLGDQVRETNTAGLTRFQREHRLMLEFNRQAREHALAHHMGYIVGKELLASETWERKDERLAPEDSVRDHRPLMNNGDDYLRMASVPKIGPNTNFRGMPGVVVNEDGTICAGHWHAHRRPPKLDKDGQPKEMPCGCPAGGMFDQPLGKKGKEARVDHAGAATWRGAHLPGCPSRLALLPSNDTVCPRWCVTYKQGKSGNNGGRHGCFGRLPPSSYQTTVVTRAEPHNLQLVKDDQDRVVTVRENARAQGFPDYYVFGGHGINPHQKAVQRGCIATRYKQIGNAVAPPLAAALGRCLLLAAAGPELAPPLDIMVAPVPDPDMTWAYEQASIAGDQPYALERNVEVRPVDEDEEAFLAGVDASEEEDDDEEEAGAGVEEADGDDADSDAAESDDDDDEEEGDEEGDDKEEEGDEEEEEAGEEEEEVLGAKRAAPQLSSPGAKKLRV